MITYGGTVIMIKTSLKNKALSLRKEGYSYSFIVEQVRISKSTLSYWLASLPYKPNEMMLAKMKKARIASGLAKSKIRLESVSEAKKQAKAEIGQLSERDLFMLGIGLYLGEGSKNNNQIRIINSDPKIIRLAIRWFREVCRLKNENFRIRIHIYPDCSPNECRKFWSKETGISESSFYECYTDRRVNKKIVSGKLPYGTAHLTVKSNGKKEFGVFLSRKIMGWIEEVLK
ncbi:MAG TPA: hypothetical protein VJH55_00985 [Candidatus Paceibacterota bacterium]